MIFEEEIVKFMKTPPAGREHEYSMDIKYWALDLITESFDYSLLAKRAKEEGINHRLGFLCEVTAQAAEEKGFENSKKLYELAKELYTMPVHWKYLDSVFPEFGKRILDNSPQNELNKKWYVKSTLTAEDIVKWAEVHSIKDHVTAPPRKTA